MPVCAVTHPNFDLIGRDGWPVQQDHFARIHRNIRKHHNDLGGRSRPIQLYVRSCPINSKGCKRKATGFAPTPLESGASKTGARLATFEHSLDSWHRLACRKRPRRSLRTRWARYDPQAAASCRLVVSSAQQSACTQSSEREGYTKEPASTWKVSWGQSIVCLARSFRIIRLCG